MIASYKTAGKEALFSEVIEKSRFLTYIYPIDDAEQAMTKLAVLRKEHSQATHVCYACCSDIAGTEMRFSDDGEPQGTAGMPMLEVIKGAALRKTLIACVRYFGGVKLGTGGLARAYGGGAAGAVTKAGIIEMSMSSVMSITVDYAAAKLLIARLKDKAVMLPPEYAEEVTLVFAVRIADVEAVSSLISECTKGKSAQIIEQKYIKGNDE